MQVNRAEAGYTDCTQGISLEECNYFTKRFLWAGRWETNLLDKFTVEFFCHRTNEFSTSSFECSIKGHNILLFLIVWCSTHNLATGPSRCLFPELPTVGSRSPNTNCAAIVIQ